MADLPLKEQAFVEHYLALWDGAKAARAAGYSVRSARQIASELLTKPDIQQAIKERMDQLKATADEVIVTLTQHKRGTLEDFIDAKGQIDIKKARTAGKMHLLKEYKTTKRTQKGITEESVEIKLHDAQSAAVQLGKMHGLFIDKIDGSMNHTGQVTQVIDLSGVPFEQLRDLAAVLAE